MQQQTVLTGLTPQEIIALLPGGKEKFRGTQIFRWIHQHLADSFDEMTNLPKDFRAELSKQFVISPLTLNKHQISNDGSTDKYLWELRDGSLIESVIIRDEGRRITACISSQVGCRMGCTFCRTGELMGFVRNLTSGEIVGQILALQRLLRENGEAITNIVFMGMGEPLDNIDMVMKSIDILNNELGPGIAQRKITVSTCGIVPGILQIAKKFRKIGVAVSLNAADNRLRSQLMPANNRYDIESIIETAREYYNITRRRITYEYILLAGVNDSDDDARALLKLARRVPSKVNLIRFNPYDESPFGTPEEERALRFQKILIEGNITAFIRKSKGSDILAACGQLATASNSHITGGI